MAIIQHWKTEHKAFRPSKPLQARLVNVAVLSRDRFRLRLAGDDGRTYVVELERDESIQLVSEVADQRKECLDTRLSNARHLGDGTGCDRCPSPFCDQFERCRKERS